PLLPTQAHSSILRRNEREDAVCRRDSPDGGSMTHAKLLGLETLPVILAVWITGYAVDGDGRALKGYFCAETNKTKIRGNNKRTIDRRKARNDIACICKFTLSIHEYRRRKSSLHRKGLLTNFSGTIRRKIGLNCYVAS